MTNQRDPNRNNRFGTRRDDGSWSIPLIVLGALLLLGLGYFAIADRDGTNRTGVSQTNQTNSPGTSKTPVETTK